MKPFFLHEHHLLYDRYEKHEAACCDKCKLQIDDVLAYTCETCNFWLHKSCALEQLPFQISHPLHPQHHLSLSGFSLQYFSCDKCFSLTLGSKYSCEEGCNFNLDLICASSSSSSSTITTYQNQRPKEIHHFSHSHELTLFIYRKTEKKNHSCYWCHNLLLSGLMSYGCLHYYTCSREVFFHESCLIDMPSTISMHHFHPSHPLYFRRYIDDSGSCNACGRNFKDGSEGYSCHKCRFNLHVGCVGLQPSLKHELHQHQLTYIFLRSDIHVRCKICNENIECSFYRCMQCNISLHFDCLKMPLRKKHEYHRHELVLIESYMEDVSAQYYCDVCEKQRKPKHPVYVCEKCSFVAHIECALYKELSLDQPMVIAKNLEETEEEKTEQGNANSVSLPQIENFHHEHPLSFVEVTEQNEGIRCEACNMEISDQAYACKSCKYYLHKTCTALPYEVLHPLHTQHSLKLFIDSKLMVRAFGCYECRESFVGFLYACFMCDFALDVKCAVLSVSKSENKRLKEMEKRSRLCPFNQDHELHFFNSVNNSQKSCGFCGLLLEGPSYGCISCSLQLHESCLGFPRKILLQFHLHPFSPLCGVYTLRSFLLGQITEIYELCHVCRDDIKGIRYSCLECNLHLHPQCVKYLKRAIRSKVHKHYLYYCHPRSIFPTRRWGRTCIECKGVVPFYPSYFCMECDVRLHFECAQLQHSVKSKYHMHPLTLKDDVTEDDFTEYYCDICEQERYLKDHGYSCTECEQGLFAAHIDCGLNSAEEIVTESMKSTEVKQSNRRAYITEIEDTA